PTTRTSVPPPDRARGARVVPALPRDRGEPPPTTRRSARATAATGTSRPAGRVISVSNASSARIGDESPRRHHSSSSRRYAIHAPVPNIWTQPTPTFSVATYGVGVVPQNRTNSAAATLLTPPHCLRRHY